MVSAPPAAAVCGRCRRRPETFDYLQGRFRFDLPRARALADDGREPVEVDEESVRVSVKESEIHAAHVDHVDPTIPGIIAHVFYPTEEGEELHAHLLIDGNHRAARCLRDGLPYFAYVLTEGESRQILLKAPHLEPQPAHHQ